MAARLKVFRTSNGLTESVVAVSSKAKALEAWGTKQDLFKEGLASETDDPALVQAALASPGQVVTRSVLTPAALKLAIPAGKKAKKKGPSKEDLAKLQKLQRKLDALEEAHAEETAEIARRREALEAEAAKAQRRYEEERNALAARLERLRREVEGG